MVVHRCSSERVGSMTHKEKVIVGCASHLDLMLAGSGHLYL